MEVTKREKKSATIKLDILISANQLVGKKSFRDLYVEDICAKAKISKVTFFKYFPQKDDILLYYLRIWCLDRAVELHHQPREGIKGLYYLMDKLSETYDRNPGLILNLISYWTSLERPPNPFPIKAIERSILYPKEPDLHSIEILSIPMMVEKFVLEAILARETRTLSDPNELTNLVLAIIYGTIVTAHTRQIKPVRNLFRRNIDSLFKK